MKKDTKSVRIPSGIFCGHNCSDGCRFWCPSRKHNNGRQYCAHYGKYYYPYERQGCLSFER